MTLLLTIVAMLAGPLSAPPSVPALDVPPAAAALEQRRIAMIERVAPTVVCIFDEGEMGGGSGVIIDEHGTGLTNYHVVAGMLDTRRGLGGLSDGKLYTLEVLGIDPGGDVAMFRLVGKPRFDFAPLGDSDAVRVGHTAIAMGNPFVISEDYTPTVTRGLVTGVNRYQYGSGNQLVYSDCIQVDTPINPGNSGGPLFNEAGEVIGINGRISVNTRGRFNVGFGYAISINQIKRFVPALRAGLLARHGTLQATVTTMDEGPPMFNEIMRQAPAHDAGIRVGDRLVSFDDVPVRSANHFASLLGTYPEGWRVPVVYEREGRRERVITRLEPLSVGLQAPWEVDPAVNLREVGRVLDRYRAVVGYDGDDAAEQTLAWTLVREVTRAPAAGEGEPAVADAAEQQRYSGELPPSGPATLQRVYDEGATGGMVEYDAVNVVRRLSAEAEPAPVPMDEAMVMAAVYIAQRQLSFASGDLEFSDVSHVGSDALVPAEAPPAGAPVERTILELIDWPVSDGARAKFGFDSETGLLRHATVQDPVSGASAEIDFLDYKEAAGVLRPMTIRVTRKTGETVDRYSDVRVKP
jgi:S1-C subfamily serine protease